MPSSTGFSVLFVCLGNICRSPAAEIVCRAALREAGLAGQVRVDSCGTASYHVGSKPDARMLAALRRAGYAYEGHRARRLRIEDGTDFDLIIPQDDANLSDVQAVLHESKVSILPMRTWFPAGNGLREVPDPYYGGEEEFDAVVHLLQQSMPLFIDDLRRRIGA